MKPSLENLESRDCPSVFNAAPWEHWLPTQWPFDFRSLHGALLSRTADDSGVVLIEDKGDGIVYITPTPIPASAAQPRVVIDLATDAITTFWATSGGVFEWQPGAAPVQLFGPAEALPTALPWTGQMTPLAPVSPNTLAGAVDVSPVVVQQPTATTFDAPHLTETVQATRYTVAFLLPDGDFGYLTSVDGGMSWSSLEVRTRNPVAPPTQAQTNQTATPALMPAPSAGDASASTAAVPVQSTDPASVQQAPTPSGPAILATKTVASLPAVATVDPSALLAAEAWTKHDQLVV